MITENTPQDICKTMSCPGETIDEKCLERSCFTCRDLTVRVMLKDSEVEDTVLYEKWVTKRVELIIKGQPKICSRTIKEKVRTSKQELANLFRQALNPFLLHVRNIIYQQRTIQAIKNNLRSDEVLIHLDFSENYNWKYGEEVQSAHFGGSKPQLSLHTVVTYHLDKEKQLIKTCFCTVSANLRHDPIAIMGHLEPVVIELKTKIDQINLVHFLSDGPTTQYRNRKMIWLVAAYLLKLLDFQVIRWHFSEKGHGKGAPDGVGGCLKRTEDSLVASGIDIPDFDSFLSHVSKKCKGIKIYGLALDNLVSIEALLPKTLPKFKGLMQTHEYIWDKSNSFMEVRKLSCLDCVVRCPHYKLGNFNVEELHALFNKRIRYSDVYSSSSSNHESGGENDEDTLGTVIENKKLQVNDYILVQLKGKKSVKKFVALVLEVFHDFCTIKYMKRVFGTNKFVFPEKQETYPIDNGDILKILDMPCINNREQYVFNFADDTLKSLQ